MVLDALFARAVWVDGLYDESTADTCGRADISLFPPMCLEVSEVVAAGDLVSSIPARHWEERPATGN